MIAGEVLAEMSGDLHVVETIDAVVEYAGDAYGAGDGAKYLSHDCFCKLRLSIDETDHFGELFSLQGVGCWF